MGETVGHNYTPVRSVSIAAATAATVFLAWHGSTSPQRWVAIRTDPPGALRLSVVPTTSIEGLQSSEKQPFSPSSGA